MNDDSTTHDYRAFVRSKLQLESLGGFTPSFMPDFLFDFQRFLVEWAVQKGRTAVLNMKAAVEGERREAPKQKAMFEEDKPEVAWPDVAGDDDDVAV